MVSPITQLFVDVSVAHDPQTEQIARRLNLKPILVSGAREVYEQISGAPDPIQQGKETLYITPNRGAFIRKCPGTRVYTCCGYYILHVGAFCTMDCAYCILQAYFHPPALQYFVNHTDMMRELEQAERDPEIVRIGSGEFTDSMIWDRWTGLSDLLIPWFGKQDRMILELKTKTAFIKPLAKKDHRRKTIMAWSVNAESVIAENERNTASLNARLRCAAQCEAWEYPLAFHFDPMVLHPSNETDYATVAQRILKTVDPRNIAWISLGAFRFMPALKTTVQQRFPHSKIVYGEFISGMDEKMRYFKPMRIRAYRALYNAIRSISSDVVVYLCMESDEVWEKSFGFRPQEQGGLKRMLDERAEKICGLRRK